MVRLVTFRNGKPLTDEKLAHISRRRIIAETEEVTKRPGLEMAIISLDEYTPLLVAVGSKTSRNPRRFGKVNKSRLYVAATTIISVQRVPSRQVKQARLWFGDPNEFLAYMEGVNGFNGPEIVASFIGAHSEIKTDSVFALVRGNQDVFRGIYELLLKEQKCSEKTFTRFAQR